MPSLEQLDQAVREFIAENPGDEVTVVVDASFGHRIDPSEVPAFEAAEEAGEVVSPPAGAIGRGDAFLLRIAEKIGATVLSNDSFQEFHGEHAWLFEKGRLIGGKPVSGVGWIFMDRTPVRGAKSREVTKEAKRRKRAETEETAGTAARGTPEKPAKPRPKMVDRAIARATQEVVEPKAGGGEGKSRRRRGGTPPAEPVNEPLAFITFIAAHPLGSEVVGAVVEYSSHGAFVEADGARCYIPLSAMADPAPRKAREVVTKGEGLSFVVQAFDPQRRGIELALPGFAHLAGGPTAETVEAEIRGEAKPAAPKPSRRRGGRVPEEVEEPAAADGPAGVEAEEAAETPPVAAKRARKARAATPATPIPPAAAGAAPVEVAAPPGAGEAPARRRRTAKAPAPAEPTVPTGDAVAEAPAPARKRAAARKAPAGGAVVAEETLAVPVKKAGPRRSPARTAALLSPAGPPLGAEEPAPARQATRKAAKVVTGPVGGEEAGPARTAAVEKAPARRAVARKATVEKATVEKATAEKATAEKAIAEKASARKAVARKAVARKATAEKAIAEKAPARKAAARKSAARKATAEKAPVEQPTAEKAPARRKGPAGGGDADGRGEQAGAPERPARRRRASSEAG